MSDNNWRIHSKNHAQSHDFHALHDYAIKTEDLFRLHVPQHYKHKIDFNNANDPLLLQILPSVKENKNYKNAVDDPVGDLSASKVKGVIHKYHGRVLLITTGICAINCRYCFRRNFPYKQNFATAQNWQNAINYIKNNTEIHEVILSGGDPLMLSTKVLNKLTIQLESIKHLKTLRIHTRMPIVTPTRVTQNLLYWLDEIKLKKVIVVHCNHPQELDESHKPIFQALAKTNSILLNQSVLLKNINDNAVVLTELSHKLFACGILPYYLNQLDKATGTVHFAVKNSKAKELHKQLLKKLSGYLVPKLVIEIQGKSNKTPLF